MIVRKRGPSDPDKTEPGTCGCGTPDADSDEDGFQDCLETCDEDPDKIAPGICGCGMSDTDSDYDGVPDCNDTNVYGPELVAPEDDNTDISLIPQLQTGMFDETGLEGTHELTLWQLGMDSGFSFLVLDVASPDHLTTLDIPLLMLAGNTEYYWRARYVDSQYMPTPWSTTFSFTTMADPLDTDEDGVPDDQVVADEVDLDGNGERDNAQLGMLSVQTVVGNAQDGHQGHRECNCCGPFFHSSPVVIARYAAIGRMHLPLGLISFKLSVAEGATCGCSPSFYLHRRRPVPDGASMMLSMAGRTSPLMPRSVPIV